MTLHRVEETERDAAGRVIRRGYRYVDLKGAPAATRPAPFRPAAHASDTGEVLELRNRVAQLEQRIAEILARPEMPPAPVAQPGAGPDAQCLTRALADSQQRIAALEARLAQADAYGDRLTSIESALGALAELSARVANETAAD